MAYQLDYLETLPALFNETVSRYHDSNMFAKKIDGEFSHITYGEARNSIELIAMGLQSLGYDTGDHVAILSENKPEWILTDYACAYFGIVSVPVYPTLLPEQISYILNDSEATLVFVSNKTQAEKIISIKDRLPHLKYLVLFEDNENFEQEWILDLFELQKRGSEFRQTANFTLEDEGIKRTKEDLWTIIYTSGTTGTPKGVMLTQFNAASNVQASQAALQFGEKLRWISFLPYSHSLERIAAHMAISIGSSIFVIESIEKVLDALKTYKPHHFVSVPRLYEKMYNTVLEQVHRGSAIKRAIFNWATKVGGEVSKNYLQRGKEPHGFLGWEYSIAKKLVFSKITDLFGGEAILTISGGAPLAPEIGQFFASAGLLIAEGFGLTEMSPVTNANLKDNIKFGTVGPTLPDVQLKFADDGEILFKGPNMMRGYYNNPEATDEVIDDEGWLHSGDIGELDDGGALIITDRKKNLIVTSGGKNVAPAPLESQISGSRYIDQVLVIGDKRKFLSALLVPNQESLEYWAKSNGLSFTEFGDLLQTEQVEKLIKQEVKDAQGDFAKFEQIKKFRLIEKPFTVEDGELTPTLKVKRRVVEEKYQDLIEDMYPSS